jgi:hypothetical protein
VDPSPSVRPEAREVLRQLEQIRPGSDGGAGPSDDVPPVSGGGDDVERITSRRKESIIIS